MYSVFHLFYCPHTIGARCLNYTVHHTQTNKTVVCGGLKSGANREIIVLGMIDFQKEDSTEQKSIVESFLLKLITDQLRMLTTIPYSKIKQTKEKDTKIRNGREISINALNKS